MSYVPARSRALYAVLIVALHATAATAQGEHPAAEVRGHGSFHSAMGSSGADPDQITIDASLDQSGIPHGTVAWTSVTHGLLPGSTRYAWQLAVTGLLVENNQALIQAVVVSSQQFPQDVGIQAVFAVVDNGNGQPSDEISAYFSPSVSIIGGNFKVKSNNGNVPPACAVRGHGTWSQTVGAPEGGQLIDQISINAWLGGAGDPQGMIVWDSINHQIPDTTVFSPGPAGAGHRWYIDVTTLGIVGTTAQVQGVVVHSPHAPQEEGVSVSFTVEDLGNGGSSQSDRLSGIEILGGNFTVTGSCSTILLPYRCDMDGDGAPALYYYPGAPPPGSFTCSPIGPDSVSPPCWDSDDNDGYIGCP